MTDFADIKTARQEAEADDLVRAFHEVFALDSGKRVLFWLLEECAIYRDAFTGEDNATNYTLGLQAGGRKLMAMLDSVDPRYYPQLLLRIADLRAMENAAVSGNQTETETDVF